MTQSILVTSGRGGAGKSVVCAHLGAALAAQGKSVLLVEGARRALDVLFDLADSVLFDLSDAAEGRCELSDAILTPGGGIHLLCAPVENRFEPDAAFCAELLQTLNGHFDYILVEADGQDMPSLDAWSPAVNRAVIVSAADRVSARLSRAVSDRLAAGGVRDVRLCINLLTEDFVRLRPIPDLDWLIDQVCAQLVCVLPFDPALLCTRGDQSHNLSNISKTVFDNFAQRIMGNYIDLLVQ